MRNALLPATVTIAAFLVAAPAIAKEKVCQRSCTNVAETCVTMGASRAACFADMNGCMQTGNLHMPSGRVFTNLCKR